MNMIVTSKVKCTKRDKEYFYGQCIPCEHKNVVVKNTCERMMDNGSEN